MDKDSWNERKDRIFSEEKKYMNNQIEVLEKYNKWNLKFTVWSQLQNRDGRRRNQWTWRKINRKYLKKEHKEHSLRDLWDNIQMSNVHVIEFTEKRRKRWED